MLSMLLSLGLVHTAFAEVNFVTYLKRNHQLINKNRETIEKVAFKEKQRSIASVPSTDENKTSSSNLPSDANKNPITGASDAPSEIPAEGADSSSGGPNR